MIENKKPSFWTRLTWIFTGKPVTHEEQQAARASHTRDAMTQVQLDQRGQRFQGFGL